MVKGGRKSYPPKIESAIKRHIGSTAELSLEKKYSDCSTHEKQARVAAAYGEYIEYKSRVAREGKEVLKKQGLVGSHDKVSA